VSLGGIPEKTSIPSLRAKRERAKILIDANYSYEGRSGSRKASLGLLGVSPPLPLSRAIHAKAKVVRAKRARGDGVGRTGRFPPGKAEIVCGFRLNVKMIIRKTRLDVDEGRVFLVMADETTTLKYRSALAAKYGNYQVSDEYVSSLDRTQRALQSCGEEMERVRAAYGKGEEGFEHDLEKEERYKQFLANCDQLFKQTMDEGWCASLIGHAASQTSSYARSNGVPSGFEFLVDNLDEDRTAQPLNEVFASSYKTLFDDYKGKRQKERFDVAISKTAYKKFRRIIFEASHDPDEEEDEPLETYFDDFEEADEDMVVAREVVSYKCPLTKQYFEDPVTSSVCGHSFSKEAIYDVIHTQTVGRNGRIKCPVQACRHFYGISDLKPAPELAKQMQTQIRREIKASQARDAGIERL
jgi:hypothetical protein